MSKKKYGKWIGGALGWAFGGPLGALFGFAVGSMFDGVDSRPVKQTADEYARARTQSYRYHTTSDDFMMSLLALSAAIMKADGHNKKSELNYIKKFFEQQFGTQKTKESLAYLRDLLKRDIPVRQVCEQIRYNMEYALRLQLMHYLYGIAKADGDVNRAELDLLKKIAGYLTINQKDYSSIVGMFYSDSKSAYDVLEINKSVTDAEVKVAYRKMAKKYHPDKLAHLGPEFKNAAKEKFIKVQEAYEHIKKERGMN